MRIGENIRSSNYKTSSGAGTVRRSENQWQKGSVIVCQDVGCALMHSFLGSEKRTLDVLDDTFRFGCFDVWISGGILMFMGYKINLGDILELKEHSCDRENGGNTC